MRKTLSVSEFARSAGITKKYAFDLAQSGRLGATKDERGRWAVPVEALKTRLRLRNAQRRASAELARLSAMAHKRKKAESTAPPDKSEKELVVCPEA